MGYRLTKIYTRTGDDGTTGSGDGRRVAKDSARIAAYGDLDELNCLLGLLLTHELPGNIRDGLITLQHWLFELGGDLCIAGRDSLTDAHTGWLEQHLDELNETLPPLTEFVLPGGSPATATCHLARSVCRRAERSLVTLRQAEPVPQAALAFVNRLSDYLFVVARVLGRSGGQGEVLWQPGRR